MATELMRAAVQEAAQRGFATLRLWTPRGASRARRFYEREGWQLTGSVHEDSPFGLATVEYRRDVPQADPAAIVERYFTIVGDLSSSAEALLAVLHPDVRITEHPNAINPRGAIRDRDAALAAFLAGKRLLAAQAIDLHEILVSGNRVAVRATWRGTIGKDTESLPKGTELVAHIAGMLTVDEGRIRAHETFDCYEPWRRDRQT